MLLCIEIYDIDCIYSVIGIFKWNFRNIDSIIKTIIREYLSYFKILSTWGGDYAEIF